MKKEDFIQFVAKNIKYHLPSEFKDFKIEVGKHMGLVISEKKSPNTIRIYLDEAYEKFMENKNIFPVMETVANNITQGWHTVEKIRDEKRQAIEFVNNYAEVKKHLQFVLRDPDFTEIPMNQIKTELGSYVALYEINMDKNDAEHISIPITDKLTKRWGITADQLYQDTIKVQAAWNQPLLADLLEMGTYLNGGTRPDNLLSADKIDDTGLYVLTNYKLYNGAAMIAHDEMAQKIGNLLQMDYYILPSTVHELLVYPDNGVISITQLQEMVKSVNATDVLPKDRLSDKVLFYNQQERRLELATEREQIIDRSNDSPVYAGTLEQAVRQKDADAYLDSRKLNIDCKKAIEEAIQENYDGIRLKDDVAKDVVRRFGEERMNFVMANTIRESFLEGRFSKQNKEWAEHINIPENISHGRNLNLDYIIESHPVVLDDFISMARFEIRMLKIERAIEDAEVPITVDTNDYVADGHEGAWHTIEERKYAGEKFFLMEHNKFGSNVAELIVTENGQLVAEDLWNGFDKGALEAISEYLQDKGISEEEIYKEPDELAYKIHDGYFSIHRTDGGYDYTFYTKDYEDIDGGIYDNPDSPIKQVVEDILEDAGISLDDAEWIDYEELDAEVEHAEEIKQLAVDLDKFSYEYDTYEYKDSIEDREKQIDKLTEDILTRKTGDIKKWLIEVSENSEIDNDVRTARSLFSRLEEAERVFISDETNVSFYAAECMEFPDFGELHENLTLDEAIKKYESIPEERMHGVKGIGFELEDGSDYEGKYGLMYHGRVDRENVEMIQYYKDNPVIQKALDALEQYCETSADKSVERQQETNRKKKQKSIYQGLHR